MMQEKMTDLLYPDDIALIVSTEGELRTAMHGDATTMGMKCGKTEVMKVCGDTNPITVTIDGKPFKHSLFKYLGARFNFHSSCKVEINSR